MNKSDVYYIEVNLTYFVTCSVLMNCFNFNHCVSQGEICLGAACWRSVVQIFIENPCKCDYFSLNYAAVLIVIIKLLSKQNV